MKPVREVYEAGPRYAVGQSVGLASPVGLHMRSPSATLHLGSSAVYEILAVRPAVGRSPQYKVRSKSEPYDRMVSEYEIIA